MSGQTKLFTCPTCRSTYLGHDPLPDCPHCGYDYRIAEGFRWDVLVYLLLILALASFLLVGSQYRRYLTPEATGAKTTRSPTDVTRHTAPATEPAGRPPVEGPYHGAGR